MALIFSTRLSAELYFSARVSRVATFFQSHGFSRLTGGPPVLARFTGADHRLPKKDSINLQEAPDRSSSQIAVPLYSMPQPTVRAVLPDDCED